MFAKALKALGPYLGDLVVVGGWAHRLFGLHSMARAPGFQPLMTEDADIAAPVRMPKKGESIAALLKREGFAEHFFGDETPPVSEYRIGDSDGGLYLEFLVPLIGSEHRGDGSRTRRVTRSVAPVSMSGSPDSCLRTGSRVDYRHRGVALRKIGLTGAMPHHGASVATATHQQ